MRTGIVLLVCAALVLPEPLAAYAGAASNPPGEIVRTEGGAVSEEGIRPADSGPAVDSEPTEGTEDAGPTEEPEDTEKAEGTEDAGEVAEPESTEQPGDAEGTELPEKPEETEAVEPTENTEPTEDTGPTEEVEDTEPTEETEDAEPPEGTEEPEETEMTEDTEATEDTEETEETEAAEETEESGADEESARPQRDKKKKIEGKIDLKGAVQAGVSVDEMNFPDDNFRAYVLRFDLDNDGVLGAEELARVTEINVNARKWSDDQKIKSLEGVEFFSSLRKLDCAYNRLSMLDVRGCSQLETLACSSSGLRKIAVSDLASLQVLVAADNSLSNLDLSGCVSLVNIDVSINKLERMDVGFCTKLRVLNCGNNARLTSLQTDGCAALEELYCNNTKIERLNLQPLTRLKVLNCKSNDKLTGLDIKNMPQLQTVYCGGGNKSAGAGLKTLSVIDCGSLKRLILGSGQVTELVVRNCAKLENLQCSDNQIAKLRLFGCAGLETLNCGRNQLDRLDVRECPAIREIYCDNNRAPMTLAAKNCANLKVLYCYDSNVTGLDVRGCKKLLRLNCRNNRITDLKFSGAESLEYLWCRNNQLTELNVSKLKKLEWLDCANNRLSVLNVAGNKSLKKLQCADNLLETLDISKCTKLELLQCNRNRLYRLDIRKNKKLSQIGYEGNCYTIKNGTVLDMRTLPGFELSRAINWAGCDRSSYGTGPVMTLTDFTTNTISYEYDINRGYFVRFSIKFENPGAASEIRNLVWELADDTCTYTGKAVKAKVCAADGMVRSTDYTVAYRNNIKPGIATAVIRGKGRYKGKIELTYKIVPRKVSVSALTSKKSKKAVLIWKRDKAVDGYEILYSTDKSFKKGVKQKIIKKNSTVKATLNGLKGGKTYYVRIRAYKKTADGTFRGSWSKTKTVKVKK